MSDQPPVHVTINNSIPERQMNFQAGDVIIQPSPPADVRVELPVTFHPPDIQVPVSVTTPDVRIDSPVTVNTPEVKIPVNVQPANAPNVTVESPVTVNTPEMKASDVTVQPAVVNVAMPEPRSKTKKITTKRNSDGSSTATIREEG
jgi:hypothetical protein